MRNSKYKALLFDVDGTIIQVKEDAIPSKGVTESVKKAKVRIHVGVVTGRPLNICQHILKHLDLEGPSIINGGAQVIDAKTFKVLWEQNLLDYDVETVKKLIGTNHEAVIVDRNNRLLPLYQTDDYEGITKIVVYYLLPEEANIIIEQLSTIKTIAVHKTSCFVPGKINLDITHSQATKQQGILKVAEILDIDTRDIIGVGDAYNDFPLLLACGLKVAMGNAVNELKEIADYVAPSLNQDGVANVIQKFVL